MKSQLKKKGWTIDQITTYLLSHGYLSNQTQKEKENCGAGGAGTVKVQVAPSVPPTGIPTSVSTEWIESETLKQYYMSTEPKDRQKYLDILQKIWCTKNKVPDVGIKETIGMEELLVRVSHSKP